MQKKKRLLNKGLKWPESCIIDCTDSLIPTQKLQQRTSLGSWKRLHTHTRRQWTKTHKERVCELLKDTSYMSSETSAEESDAEDYAIKTRTLPWLRKKYRKAFHTLDSQFTSKMSKRSKSMKKPRVVSKQESKRPMPDYSTLGYSKI